MSGTNSPPSGVRGLRAKFEPTESSSPPRGRSPASSNRVSSDGSSTSRPRATVRTSFVPVESPKGADQRRITPEACAGSTAHKRRESFSMDESTDPRAMAALKDTMSHELDKRRKSLLMETVPEVALVTPALERREDELFPRSTTLTEKPDAMPTKEAAETVTVGPASSEGEADNQRKSEPVEEPVSRKQNPSPHQEKFPPYRDPQDRHVNGRAKSTVKGGRTEAEKPREKRRSLTEPVDISTSKEAALEPRAQPRPSPAKASPFAKASTAFSPNAASSTSSNKTTIISTKSPGTPSGPSRFANGFSRHSSAIDNAKPRPRSQVKQSDRLSTVSASSSVKPAAQGKPPTRVVTLPKSATATTASSAAKSSASRSISSSSQTIGGPGATSIVRRQLSRRNGPPPVLSRESKVSEIRKSDPTRPPQGSRASKEPGTTSPSVTSAGQGFLARMMRPTASSASKTHERSATVSRPTTSQEHAGASRKRHTSMKEKGLNEAATPAGITQTTLRPASEGTNPGEEVVSRGIAEPSSNEVPVDAEGGGVVVDQPTDEATKGPSA